MSALCVLLLMQVAPVPQALSVMTFNVRYDNPDDGPSAWPHRSVRVAAVMKQASVVGVQEALHHQVMELQGSLEDFAWIGIGRRDGESAGEYAPVFFRVGELDLLESGTFWLSETPDIPGSRSWDAAVTRIATWGQFIWRASGDTLWVFNTHFDHRGQQARQESARLLMQRIAAIADGGRVIVTGDFNAAPENPVYVTMTSGVLRDAYAASQEAPRGPEGTFSGFIADEEQFGRRIDYVFADSTFSVLSYEAVVDVEDGRYVSDHLPVVARLAWDSR